MDGNNQQEDAGHGGDEHIITVSTKNTTESPGVESHEESRTPSIEPSALEAMTIEAEVEPATVSSNPQPTISSEIPATPSAGSPKISTMQTNPAPSTSTLGLMIGGQNKKRLMIMAAAGISLLLITSALTWWFLGKDKGIVNDQQEKNVATKPAEKPRMGIAATIADGTVEYLRQGPDWQTLTPATNLQEGDMVRTGAQSRAVLTLDDGSAVRLDADTSITIASLVADDIKISQTTGALYSRVVPSDRKYTVKVESDTYEALGTAFATTNTLGESGVQVYQSSVKASGAAEAVAEGRQYYKLHSDAALAGKVTDINIDGLINNAFINWNLDEDEKETLFKDKLGVLPHIRQRAEEKAKQERAEEAARQQAAREAAEKEKLAAEEKKQTAGGKVVRGEMALSATHAGGLAWTYTGKAVYGYKLLYSKKTAEPVFGASGVESIYFSGIGDTSGTLPKKSEIGGGIYKVRVCAYTNGTENDACVDYSNTVQIVIN